MHLQTNDIVRSAMKLTPINEHRNNIEIIDSCADVFIFLELAS